MTKNPIEHIVRVISPGRPYEEHLSDPEVAHALTEALLLLGYCEDAIAILVFRLGISNEPYPDIRSQLDRASNED